jgi:hypothetical protein
MEVSELRRRVRDTVTRAKQAAADRRTRMDEANAEYQTFLDGTAVPLFRQLANVLRADKHPFSVSTPGGAARLSTDRSNDDYIEVFLDTTNAIPKVIVHSVRSRGRRTYESEIAIGQGGPVRDLTEEDLLSVVLKELEGFLER